MNKQKRADLLFIIVTGFWGSTYYLTDLCMKEMPPMFLNAFRFISAFLILGIVFFKKIIKVNLITLKYSVLIGIALTGTYIFTHMEYLEHRFQMQPLFAHFQLLLHLCLNSYLRV